MPHPPTPATPAQAAIPLHQQPSFNTRLEQVLLRTAQALALGGGVLFVGLIAMSLVSIVGRKLGFGSVNGDIELMQAGTAVAAVAFLPYCTLLGEHIKVDFFTEHLRSGLKLRLDGVADLLLTAASALLLWRTSLAALDAYDSGESTPLVELPLWIPIGLLLPSLALMVLCAGFRAYTCWCPSSTMTDTHSTPQGEQA